MLYLLILYISAYSISPQPLHIDRRSLLSHLSRPKASQRSLPLTRIISAAQSSLRLCVKSLIIKSGNGSQYKSDEVGTCQCREGLHALPKIMFDLSL